jgi:hypothetical protein
MEFLSRSSVHLLFDLLPYVPIRLQERLLYHRFGSRGGEVGAEPMRKAQFSGEFPGIAFINK